MSLVSLLGRTWSLYQFLCRVRVSGTKKLADHWCTSRLRCASPFPYHSRNHHHPIPIVGCPRPFGLSRRLWRAPDPLWNDYCKTETFSQHYRLRERRLNNLAFRATMAEKVACIWKLIVTLAHLSFVNSPFHLIPPSVARFNCLPSIPTTRPHGIFCLFYKLSFLSYLISIMVVSRRNKLNYSKQWNQSI